MSGEIWGCEVRVVGEGTCSGGTEAMRRHLCVILDRVRGGRTTSSNINVNSSEGLRSSLLNVHLFLLYQSSGDKQWVTKK